MQKTHIIILKSGKRYWNFSSNCETMVFKVCGTATKGATEKDALVMKANKIFPDLNIPLHEISVCTGFLICFCKSFLKHKVLYVYDSR